MKMIIKKVISAMAIVGMLATSGAVMAAENNSNQDAAASKSKIAVGTSVQNQYQYRNGGQEMNQLKCQNGTQSQKADCDQSQTHAQTQSGN
jgi:hypothetical protein